MLGRAVTLPARPRRVVSLAPSVTETVFALGAGESLAGVTEHCDYPPEALGKTRIGGIYTPSFELIVSLAPDLVLGTSEGNREEHVRALEALGLPVYVVRPVDLATTLEAMERVGAVLGREGEAAALVTGLRAEAAAARRAAEGARRPRVLYVVWGDPLIVPGRDTLITDLLRHAGGESVTADEPLAYPRLSLEEALARRPDVVVVATHGAAPLARRLREWPGLALLPAVREGRAFAVDADLAHRPGPRVGLALRALARIFHPPARATRAAGAGSGP
jgi:iron complex transport system substrate-binding protein